MKVSLATITPSHYRKRIYSLLDSEMNCSFIFGKDKTTVKRMDTSIFHDCLDLDNRYIGSSHWYYQKGLLRKLRDSDVVIDDLGIFCLSSWQLLLSAKFKKQKGYHWDHGWYGREGFLNKWINNQNRNSCYNCNRCTNCNWSYLSCRCTRSGSYRKSICI